MDHRPEKKPQKEGGLGFEHTGVFSRHAGGRRTEGAKDRKKTTPNGRLPVSEGRAEREKKKPKTNAGSGWEEPVKRETVDKTGQLEPQWGGGGAYPRGTKCADKRKGENHQTKPTTGGTQTRSQADAQHGKDAKNMVEQQGLTNGEKKMRPGGKNQRGFATDSPRLGH